MPNDAKLGLVLGVGLVVVIAVVFSRREPAAAAGAAPAPAAVAPAGPGLTPLPRNEIRPPPTGPASAGRAPGAVVRPAVRVDGLPGPS